MTLVELNELYQSRILTYENQRNRLIQQKRSIGWLRLMTFLTIPLSMYLLHPNWQIAVLIALPAFAGFLYLVSLFTDLKQRLKFVEKMIQLNKSEIKSLNKDYSDFECGSEFADTSHPYAIDMDLFHPNGLFAFLNRTATQNGKKMLSTYLLHGKKQQTPIQDITEELKEKLDWRQQYLAGATIENNNVEEDAKRWINLTEKSNKSLLILRWILPTIALSALTCWLLNQISDFQFILLILIPLTVVGFYFKRTNYILITASKANEKWHSMRNRLDAIQSANFTSPGLIQLKEKLTGGNSTSVALKQLIKLNNLSDYRLNMLMGIVLNMFFAWDIWMRTLLVQWLEEYASKFEQWEDDLAELEVWICAGNYAFNRNDLVYAELGSDEIVIEQLGHPLLSEDEGVKNNFVVRKECAFSIITGPNMAGKSTFLRSVGVNLILAHCGFPVVASVFKMPDLKLYSSMRTSDDLASSSSYFFAELSRLRFIVDAIERGEKVFIILDEILKGTNSIDKEKGSAAFLMKLQQLNAKGIIATHDLSLCQLAENSDVFQNLYFDSIIDNNNLSFDYQIRDGVCQNMNASFLLQKMGLT